RILTELRSAVRSRYRFATVQTTPVDQHGHRQYRLRTQCGIVENDELHRIWGTTRDISELKRAELAVEAAVRRFREVLQHIRAPVLILDLDGTITFCNAALIGLARSSRDKLVGRSWPELIANHEERAAWNALLADDSGEAEPQSHF